ncbi:MAG TPA: anthranilate synthase component I family protein [Homoserinimonas sp.]|nr:anthranilate synthase component I family protein [Homoserinimonas sp.]
MRVLSFPVPHRADPGVVFTALYGAEQYAVWLDSGKHAPTGMSLMGSAARRLTASVADETVTVDGIPRSGTVFDFLRDDLEHHSVPERQGFALGWVGWLGYELRAQTMKVGLSSQSRYPDAALVFLDRGIVFDHATGTATLLALGESWEGEVLAWRDGVAEQLAELAGQGGQLPGLLEDEPPPVEWAYSDEEYLAMIRACQDSIVAGDAYQLCLTTEARVGVRPDPLATYLALRESSPTHHGAYLRMGEVSVQSASPEQFIAVSPSGQVQTSPIKGTRRRGKNAEDDARLREELLASDKERAENLMIVDLMRNDIGRIAAVGSVRVSSLLAVESYAQVHQLVSTVRGTLAEGVSGIDAVVSCFPAGSMTGAPKRSATTILDRLERRPRGIYSGVLGYFSLDGRIDLSMVIRSIVIDADGATVGAGGGITALSVPEDELDEVYLKAAALLQVLGVRDSGGKGRRT